MSDKSIVLNLQDYHIYFGDLGSELADLVASYSKIFVLVDEHTQMHCLPRLQASLSALDLQILTIRSGEQHKNLDTCQQLWKEMFAKQADRSSLVINLGGGVIGDMGGFVASTFMRGVDFVQIPTTLLSQVDASVGGKLGIDFNGLKNSVGLFRNPLGVFIDPEFLETLPLQEIRSGYAEIIKHTLVQDTAAWHALQQITDLSTVSWQEIIRDSVAIKHKIVSEDPHEMGNRKLLNFGHTIGHAIESVFLESSKPLLHGEAIAIGMICETYLSAAQGKINDSQLAEVTDYLLSIYGATKLDASDYPQFISRMYGDKKNTAGKINFTLLEKPGQGVINQTASEELIKSSIDYYQRLSAAFDNLVI